MNPSTSLINGMDITLSPIVMKRGNCNGLKHFIFDESCAFCRGTVLEGEKVTSYYGPTWRPVDKQVALLYCNNFPSGTWKLRWKKLAEVDVHMAEDLDICWCGRADVRRSHGCVLVHKECFPRINKDNESEEQLSRLGRALAWMNIKNVCLYRGKGPDGIPDARDYSHDAISEVGRGLGLPLCGLPMEILRHIQSYCDDAGLWTLPAKGVGFGDTEFWKVVREVDFRSRLDLMPKTEMFIVPLTDVTHWIRESASPPHTSIEDTPGLIRVTIDRKGVYEIERIPKHPEVCLGQQQFRQFVILAIQEAKMIKAYFKDGICWLENEDKYDPPLTIWDVPGPPIRLRRTTTNYCFLNFGRDVSQIIDTFTCCARVDLDRGSNAFETINLSKVGGLSFCLSTGDNISVAAYNKPAPLMGDFMRADLHPSMYVPLPSNDRILWIRLRYSRSRELKYHSYVSVLLKTELSGIVHFGRQTSQHRMIEAFSMTPRAIFRRSASRYRTLLPAHGPLACEVVGIYPKSNPDEDHEVYELDNLGPPVPDTNINWPHPPFWSWAPLDDIAEVHVFTGHSDGPDDDSGYDSDDRSNDHSNHDSRDDSFAGVRIMYINGAQRFLGGACPNKREPIVTKSPTWLYVETTARQGSTQRLRFSNGNDGCEILEGYKEYRLTGELHVWYEPVSISRSSVVQVLPSGSWRG